jgi:hypothetical protein
MTTPDELEQAVEQMEADLALAENGENQWLTVSVCTDDLRILLSERAELLATVERMRSALAACVNAVAYTEGHDGRRSYILRLTFGKAFQKARAALTGEDTISVKLSD